MGFTFSVFPSDIGNINVTDTLKIYRSASTTQYIELKGGDAGGTKLNFYPAGKPLIILNPSGAYTTFDESTPSMVSFTSTAKGVLLPRMSTAQKNAIGSPVAGLVVYDSSLNKLCVYTGAAWETVTSA